MRKSVWIFLLAVLVPSAVLGWLALRSAEEQKIILERRTAELYQRETESLATAARAVIDEQRREFTDMVYQILAKDPPPQAAQNFSARMGELWPRKAVGFSIGSDGRLLSPAPRAAVNQPDWQRFIWDNGSFLGGNIAASVYNVPVDALTQPEQMRKNKVAVNDQDQNGGKFQLNLKGQATVPATPESAKDKEAFYAMKKMQSSKTATEKEAKDVLQMQMRFGTPAGAPADEVREPQTAPELGVQTPAQVQQEIAPAPQAARNQPAAPSAPLPSRPSVEAAQRPMPPTESDFSPAPAAAPPPAPQALKPAPPAGAAADRPAGQTRGGSGFAGGSPSTPAPEQLQKQLDQAATGELRRRSDPVQSTYRQVQPQQIWEPLDRAAISNIAPETASFQMLCAGASEGILSRFVQDKLTLIFWIRPPQATDLIFGCVIDATELRDLWSRIMPASVSGENSYKSEFVLALLDDKARPVTTSLPADASRDWKRPFVASEIGEALPHWEAALYLMKPEQLQESAAGLRRTLTFLIVGMLGAIAFGGWLVVADARRQLALAQQKTDFVSNVSHELKTPLTSIRMFAELMHCGRPETQAKAPQYLRIIMVEAERLTRLINNVLDFAKLERRQKRFDKKAMDLHGLIERTWESHELHLRESGFATHWEAAAPPYPVTGDEDALAQILVNLLSNAEKYSGDRKEVDLHTYLDDHHVCVSVLDRGIGVPAGEERKIFEAFYRAHDSLSSGIQGSGLGLTLAQRLAREHDGEISYRSREGGGSAFTLRLPLAKRVAPAAS